MSQLSIASGSTLATANQAAGEAARLAKTARALNGARAVDAMVMGLLADFIKLLGLVGMGAPGIDRCRWLVPVWPGDVLSGRATVRAARLSASRPMGLITLRTEVVNQLNAKVVQLDGVGMYGLRPAMDVAP